MKLHICCFVLLITVTACRRSAHGVNSVEPESLGQSDNNLKIYLADTLRISVDSLSPANNSYFQVIFLNNTPHYVVFNGFRLSVDFYNLITTQKSKSILFQYEGPNGIGSPDWWYVHSPDSVFFLYGSNVKRVGLYNQMGLRIAQWSVTLPEPYTDYWISCELFYSFRYDRQTGSLSFWISDGNVNTLAYQRSIRHCRYNPVTLQTTVFGHLPEAYNEINYYPNNFINGYFSGPYFISWFFPLHEVQIFRNDNHELVRCIKMKSRYLPEIIEPLAGGSDVDPEIQEEAEYNMQTPFYVKMFANETGSIHYRIAKHAVSMKYPDGRMRNFNDRPFSVMVLDEDFRLIDEISFPGSYYDLFHSFAVGNRLYISMNNPLNPAASDDHLQFAIYEIR